LRKTGARVVTLGERVQELWSGYGEIRRATLSGPDASIRAAVVKYVVPPAHAEATRDAAAARSHRRKLRSYQVEQAFYRAFAARCDAACRVPAPIHLSTEQGRVLFVLEDLDAAGFDLRRDCISDAELRACLNWLAAFHATFLRAVPEGLWKVGSYWHLATRPDELHALQDRELQRAAAGLDERLNRARFRTLIHGDAKLQNFCFATAARAVAAVDFQYVGGGVGVKDVAYFLSSCLSPERLQAEAEAHLDHYFLMLARALVKREVPVDEVHALISEWRALYPVAFADFYRFLLGWEPGSSFRDRYLETVTRAALRNENESGPGA
jgi:aminoglycoside phosphotransferase (APT) family kinase protein